MRLLPRHIAPFSNARSAPGSPRCCAHLWLFCSPCVHFRLLLLLASDQRICCCYAGFSPFVMLVRDLAYMVAFDIACACIRLAFVATLGMKKASPYSCGLPCTRTRHWHGVPAMQTRLLLEVLGSNRGKPSSCSARSSPSTSAHHSQQSSLPSQLTLYRCRLQRCGVARIDAIWLYDQLQQTAVGLRVLCVCAPTDV